MPNRYMRATITQFNINYGNYSAKTENNILLVFSISGEGKLKLNDTLEVDLPNILNRQVVTKLATGEVIRVKIKENDIHDLNLPTQHGVSRVPSKERMSGI